MNKLENLGALDVLKSKRIKVRLMKGLNMEYHCHEYITHLKIIYMVKSITMLTLRLKCGSGYG